MYQIYKFLSTFLILSVLIPSLLAYSIPNSKYNKPNNRRDLINRSRTDFKNVSKNKRYIGPSFNNIHHTQLSKRCISPIIESTLLNPLCNDCGSCGTCEALCNGFGSCGTCGGFAPFCGFCGSPCDIIPSPFCGSPCDIIPPPLLGCGTLGCGGCDIPQVLSNDQLCLNEFQSASENEHALQCCDESQHQVSKKSRVKDLGVLLIRIQPMSGSWFCNYDKF
ncbi:8409_t:CDS:2 [Cetraspora pellucida]|uniref:8409_t:CDS:1 n=1 Tax=Cetraspora pellucida TaxID=1433469 RepID=A0A9N9CI32_9GLOM|nr:8409_t:CDS:2 [Cetraspora pellucida]